MEQQRKPENLGKYAVRGVLGRGAMGTVYEGWDAVIERQVAIKTVRLPDPGDAEAQEELARFRRGAQAAGRLSHPNLVGVYDYGEADGVAYIVMELIEGQTLKDALADGHRMPLADILRVMDELLSGLAYAHGRGVIHRDVKPANVILTREGQAKLTDFGIARIESSSMTQAGTVLGTPAYMSPEQFTGQVVDARTDIYAAGVMLYQLLAGERPFEGTPTAIMHKALTTRPPKPSDLSVTAPTSLDAVVERAIARRPEDRFPSAAAFAAALAAAIRSGAAPAPAPPGVVVPDGAPDATVVVMPGTDTSRRGVPGATRSGPSVVAPPPPSGPVPPPGRSGQPKSARQGLLLAVALVVLLGGGGAGAWWGWSSGLFGPSRTSDAPPKPDAPKPDAPKPDAPKPDAPKPDAPQPDAPKPDVPKPDVPKPDVPKPDAPKPDAPKPDAPKPDAPKPDAPTPDAPQPDAPKPDAPKPDAPKPDAPKPQPLRPEPDPSNVPGPPPATLLRQRLAEALNALPCALPSGDVRESGGGAIIRALVGEGVSVTRLREAVQAILPADAVEFRLREFKSLTYCRALNVIRPYAARRFGAIRSDFAISLKDGRTALLARDRLVVLVDAPEVPGVVQIDYLQHDGKVWHMHPSRDEPEQPLQPGHRAAYGEPRGGFGGWEIGEPYGRDMIIATASTNRLFAAPRPEEEDGKTYLDALKAALEAAEARGDIVFTDALVLDTSPRP